MSLCTTCSEPSQNCKCCESYDTRIKALESERDTLYDHIQKLQVTNGSLTDEVDRLRSRLEKAVKALKNVTANIGVPQPGYPSPIAHAYDIAQETLKSIEEMK